MDTKLLLTALIFAFLSFTVIRSRKKDPNNSFDLFMAGVFLLSALTVIGSALYIIWTW